MEAGRLLKKLNLQPRRTVRSRSGRRGKWLGRGALAYRDAYRSEAKRHVLAFELDSGVFAPLQIGFSGSPRARMRVNEIAALLAPLGIGSVATGGAGADTGPTIEAGAVPAMSLNGNPERYFAIDHTAADTVDHIAPDEVSRAAAVTAAIVYVVAEMPEALR